jgi:DNA adenine methylase
MKPLIAFGFYGGKSKLADYINDILRCEGTKIYIEPFGGSAAVLLNRYPQAVHEVYADASLSLCAFWRAMSKPETANTFLTRLYDTRYDNDLFKASLYRIGASEGKQLDDMTNENIINIAVACYVVYTQSRDYLGKEFRSESLYDTEDAYHANIDRLWDVSDRFKNVEVIHSKAESLLVRFNRPDTLLYLDPPYLLEQGRIGRNPGNQYRYNMSYDQHVELLVRLRTLKSKILISNYDDQTHLYKRYLEQGECFSSELKSTFQPWTRYEYNTISTIAKGDMNRTECFWCNY